MGINNENPIGGSRRQIKIGTKFTGTLRIKIMCRINSKKNDAKNIQV